MSQPARSQQRSFRLATQTISLLDRHARELSETGNHLAQRLLDEGLRTIRHPSIVFRGGPDRLRRPALAGTRLYVWQVINTLRDGGNSVADAAEYLQVGESQIRAALAYYAEFTDEIDADAREELELANRERRLMERENEILG